MEVTRKKKLPLLTLRRRQVVAGRVLEDARRRGYSVWTGRRTAEERLSFFVFRDAAPYLWQVLVRCCATTVGGDGI